MNNISQNKAGLLLLLVAWILGVTADAQVDESKSFCSDSLCVSISSPSVLFNSNFTKGTDESFQGNAISTVLEVEYLGNVIFPELRFLTSFNSSSKFKSVLSVEIPDVAFKKHIPSVWSNPIGTAKPAYSGFYNQLQISQTFTYIGEEKEDGKIKSKTGKLILFVQIFPHMLGVKGIVQSRSGETDRDATFNLTSSFLFPDNKILDQSSVAWLDNGNEGGYFSTGLFEDVKKDYNKYWKEKKAQEVPITFDLRYKNGKNNHDHDRVLVSFSEGCNDRYHPVHLAFLSDVSGGDCEGTTNINRNAMFDQSSNSMHSNKSIPQEGFSATFNILDNNIQTPYFIWQFAPTPSALANHLDSAGLFCPNPTSASDNNNAIPNAKSNFDWVKPGKAIRSMNFESITDSMKLAEECSKRNYQYILVDAGWYGNQHDPKSNPMNPIPTTGGPPINISAITAYASKLTPPVDYVFYVNDIALKNYDVDEIAHYLASHGVRGVKMGFVNVKSNENMRRVINNLKIFGKHKIVVNIHDDFREYYIQRKYPNLLSVEGVKGDEHQEEKTKHEMALPFTRMLAGRMDNTFCDNAAILEKYQVTVLYQIAKSFILSNGMIHLYWYDDVATVSSKTGSPYTLWDDMPPYYTNSAFLDSEIGRYVSVAREAPNGDWFVAAIAREDHKFEFCLDFLDARFSYEARDYQESGVETLGLWKKGQSHTVTVANHTGSVLHLVKKFASHNDITVQI